MKGSRTRLRKVLPEREREEAAVPEAIERLISRGPPAGSGIPFEAWHSWHRYGFIACPASKLRHTCSDHCCRMGADCRELDGPLRPTARLSAIGTFARSTRARQANRFAERPEFCDQYARDRGSAETVPSSSRRALPGRKLQFTNPFISSPTTKTHNARTRARARDRRRWRNRIVVSPKLIALDLCDSFGARVEPGEAGR
jgi:hypothetical protein